MGTYKYMEPNAELYKHGRRETRRRHYVCGYMFRFTSHFDILFHLTSYTMTNVLKQVVH